MAEPTIDLDIDDALLQRLSKPGPRYTSYPTAVVFDSGYGPDRYSQALGELGRSGRPISLYVHLPFCRSLCHYCACNVIVSQKPGIAQDYLDLLAREVELVGAALGSKPRVTQLHLGGGTPTYLTVEQLQRLHDLLSSRFDLSSPEEMAVEVDPRATTREQLAALAERGWNRASFGVQDFDPQVQRAVNRVQSVEQTTRLVADARELGFLGINVDLIYGLPFQTTEGFGATLERVLDMRPDRIALYSYAHVPWMRPAQTRFDRREYPLPSPAQKYALFRAAVRAFAGAGYHHLGLDHFALPDDELARSQRVGKLHRNFQGYTVRRADDLLGLGLSAIGDLAGTYAQNAKDLGAYREALEAGRLATIRGYELTPEDLRRRAIIMSLMTGRYLPAESIADLESELERMVSLEADGLVRRNEDGLSVTPLGRFFLRNVAMCFDAHVGDGPGTFSKTV